MWEVGCYITGLFIVVTADIIVLTSFTSSLFGQWHPVQCGEMGVIFSNFYPSLVGWRNS